MSASNLRTSTPNLTHRTNTNSTGGVNRSAGQGSNVEFSSNVDDIETVPRQDSRVSRPRAPTLASLHSTANVTVLDDNKYVEALGEHYESLNYEICENELYKGMERLDNHSWVIFWQNLNRWVVCFVIGVLTALVACFIDIMVRYGTKLKILYTTFINVFNHHTVFQYGHKHEKLYLGLLAWIGINIFFVALASSTVVVLAGPVAAGSGIPQIKCYLNGVMIPGVVRLKTLVAKALGVACSVCGGLSVGKEGPMIHSGAVVAAGISQGRCVSLPIDFGIFKYFRNDHEKRDFVSAGAAAGVSAAFGAPIGGVLFSLEEGASHWNQALTWRMFFASMVSFVTLSIVLSLVNKKPGLLSWNGLANFGTFDNLDYRLEEMVAYVIMGAIGGFTGAAFNALNKRLTLYRQYFTVHAWQRFLEAIIVGIISALVGFILIYSLDDCQPLGTANVTSPLSMWCKNGEYSVVGQLLFRSPEESVKLLFHAEPHSFEPYTLLFFSIFYWLLTMWTYGVSVPSGLFIPTLLVGAAWGRLFGIGLNWMFPDADIDPRKYALCGAAAQLGGVVRMTISLCTILLEATKQATFGLPIMAALMVAKWVGDWFNEGLYDVHIDLGEVPMLGWEPPRPSAHILARQVMRSPVITLQPIEKVGNIITILRHSTHHGFPIVENLRNVESPNSNAAQRKVKWQGGRSTFGAGRGRLVGLILRHQLIVLIRHRQFTRTKGDPSTMVDGAVPVTLDEFSYSPHFHPEREDLPHDELECWLDVRPYMNPNPYRVSTRASLAHMFTLFRGLGLRYVVVIDDDNVVEGMVTRKDIARYRTEREGFKYKVKEIYISTGFADS